jgi:hypothetical protein
MAALDKAREMMDAYDVTDQDLAFDGEQVVKGETYAGDSNHIRDMLGRAVAQFCDCKVWMEGARTKIVFFGLETDTVFAKWLLDTLHDFVKRQSLAFLADMGKAVGGVTDLFGAPLNGHLREQKRVSFIYGCCHRISQRLIEAARERAAHSAKSTGRDLVVVKNALVEDAFAKLGFRLKKHRGGNRSIGDSGAFQRGVAAGEKASFGRPVGGRGGAKPLAIGRSTA